LANLTALCLDVENKEQLAQTWKDEKSSSAAKNLREKSHRAVFVVRGRGVAIIVNSEGDCSRIFLTIRVEEREDVTVHVVTMK
jgi:hypothetical protein